MAELGAYKDTALTVGQLIAALKRFPDDTLVYSTADWTWVTAVTGSEDPDSGHPIKFDRPYVEIS